MNADSGEFSPITPSADTCSHLHWSHVIAWHLFILSSLSLSLSLFILHTILVANADLLLENKTQGLIIRQFVSSSFNLEMSLKWKKKLFLILSIPQMFT